MHARHDRLLRAILDVFANGLPQDAPVDAFMESTHGGASLETVRHALSRRDDPDAATLAALLLSPSQDVLAALEPAAQDARCCSRQAHHLAQAAEARVTGALLLFGAGGRLEIELLPGEAADFVRRLRLDKNAPRQVLEVAARRYSHKDSLALGVLLRHCGLAWTPQREAFVVRLLENLPAADAGASSGGHCAALDVLRWALAWLGSLPGQGAPLDALPRTYHELSAQLRRARDYQELLARSSFEILSAQGMRAPHLHPGTLAGELALLDAVCRATTGHPAWTFNARVDTDLGCLEDCESLMEALRADQ